MLFVVRCVRLLSNVRFSNVNTKTVRSIEVLDECFDKQHVFRLSNALMELHTCNGSSYQEKFTGASISKKKVRKGKKNEKKCVCESSGCSAVISGVISYMI